MIKSSPVFKMFVYTVQRLGSWECGDVISKLARGKPCAVLIWPLDGWWCSQMVRCPYPTGKNPVVYCEDGKMTVPTSLVPIFSSLSGYTSWLGHFWTTFSIYSLNCPLSITLLFCPSLSLSVHHSPSLYDSPSVHHLPSVHQSLPLSFTKSSPSSSLHWLHVVSSLLSAELKTTATTLIQLLSFFLFCPDGEDKPTHPLDRCLV